MHTKGPWKNAPDMRGIGNLPVVGIVDSYGNAIANLGTQGADNARLICAAPDMLEALREISNYLDLKQSQFDMDYPPDHAIRLTCQRMRDLASSAIAKATGSQS